MKKIQIDILMTVHNGEKFLKQTIDSMINQKFKNWKLIIINNNSTDNTSKLLNKFQISSKKIKVFNTKRLLKRPKVLNFGLKLCKSNYIGILDADDIVNPNWLSDIEAIIKRNKKFGAIIGNYIPIDEKSKKLKKRGLFKIKQGTVNQSLSYTFPCAHSGSIFNGNILKKFKYPYEESLSTGHDWRLFLKIAILDKILFVNKNWILWRRYSQSHTAKNKIISKTDILRNLIYAKNSQLKTINRMKNNFMIFIQLYHLFKLFAIKKKINNFLLTFVLIFFFPIICFKNIFFLQFYLKQIRKL